MNIFFNDNSKKISPPCNDYGRPADSYPIDGCGGNCTGWCFGGCCSCTSCAGTCWGSYKNIESCIDECYKIK